MRRKRNSAPIFRAGLNRLLKRASIQMGESAKEVYVQLSTWERKILERKIAEQERIIDDQCDTIVDLVNTLDTRDVQ